MPDPEVLNAQPPAPKHQSLDFINLAFALSPKPNPGTQRCNLSRTSLTTRLASPTSARPAAAEAVIFSNGSVKFGIVMVAVVASMVA